MYYEDVLKVVQKAKTHLNNGVTGISQSIEDILYIQQFLPNAPKFTWILYGRDKELVFKHSEKLMKNYDDIKIILVKAP